MDKVTIINRRRGNVARLLVELDASQARTLDETTARLGITKTDAVAAALNIWFGLVGPRKEAS